MIDDPDKAGWKDPNPPKRVGDLLGDIMDMLSEPEFKPGRKEVKCLICHRQFSSSAFWFGRTWKYATICFECSDNYSFNQYRRTTKNPRSEYWESPGLKQFYCPGCGNIQPIRPTKVGLHWVYEMKCNRCEIEGSALYHAYRRKDKHKPSDAGEEPDQ